MFNVIKNLFICALCITAIGLGIAGLFLPKPQIIEIPIYQPIQNTDPPETTFVEDTTEPQLTVGEQNCLAEALSYIDLLGFSKAGLIKQLEFNQYTESEIKFAIENCGADWNAEAVECAQGYTDTISLSRQALYDQLEYEGFEETEINYALEQLGYKAP